LLYAILSVGLIILQRTLSSISIIKPWDILKIYWSHHLFLVVNCIDFSFGSHTLNLQLTPRLIACYHYKDFRKLFLAFSYEVRAAFFTLFFLMYGSRLFVLTRYSNASSNVTTRCHLSPAKCRL
ncbi:hypothetical protein C0J52_11819, partial [Blattella germanica]